MNSVVVIPAWRRPEMLILAIRRIMLAGGWKENRYHLSFDKEPDEENWETFGDFERGGAFCPGFSSSVSVAMERRGIGNSDNILTGLARGLWLAEHCGVEVLHLIEEDVWVGADYFSSAEKIHQQFKPWALSLCRNQFRTYEPKQDPALVYLCQDYQSLGVSFPLDSVREILVHNVPEYFEDMAGYLKMMFPNSRYRSLFPEQDGLIARIIEKNNYEVFYSNVPRAYHAGFYSYHRAGREPEGTLEEKIAQLENMSEPEMNERSVYKDIRQIDLNKDYKVQEFYLE